MEENNNVQGEVNQDTIPDTEHELNTQAQAENSGTDTATQDPETDEGNATRAAEENAGESAADNADNAVPTPFITVRYNHEDRELSQEEAVSLAQKGLHYDTLHGKLDYVASLQGIDVNTLVDRLMTAPEEAHRKHLEELYGEDSEDVKIGMDIFKSKQSENYKKYVADRENAANEKEAAERQSVESRLADEYRELKAEITDAPEYSALPDSVIREAASGKRDLYSAYLRYLHNQKTKVDTVQKAAEEAASASAGSMEAGNVEHLSSDERQFLAGLWDK